MIEKAINKILGLANIEKFDFDGRLYTSRQIVGILEPKMPCLDVNTLEGLVDYLKSGFDCKEIGMFIPEPVNAVPSDEALRVALHVESPTLVTAFLPVGGPWKERVEVIQAKWNREPYPFGQWLDQETFVIRLLAMFQENEDLVKVLELAGKIICEDKAEITDNGTTQAVTVQKGFQKESGKIIPLRPKLKPVRTFTEVAQPESEFVFRMRQVQGVQLSLHEADMGAWEIEVKEKIGKYLAEYLPGVPLFR